MDLKCIKCGSEKIVPLVNVQDQGDNSDGALRAFIGYTNPEAWVFKGAVYARLKARICGDCGFTELYAENPEEIHEAYLKTKPPHGEALKGDWKIVIAAGQKEKVRRRVVYEAFRRHHIVHWQASQMADAFHSGMKGELAQRDPRKARAIVNELVELGIDAELVEPPGLSPTDEVSEAAPPDKEAIFDPTDRQSES